MKKNMKLCAAFCFYCLTANSQIYSETPQDELRKVYQLHCEEYSDVKDHIPVLRGLAKNCSSVVEIGIRSMVSSWGILQGLSESSKEPRFYLGIDLVDPPIESVTLARRLAQANGIAYTFLRANDMEVELPNSDMLFIDSLHTYCHLTYELETFSPKIAKYIVMHDTSWPWEAMDDREYNGDYSEYPAQYDRQKRGLWPAVVDFLSRHPEWTLIERRLNSHGLTILKRVSG